MTRGLWLIALEVLVISPAWSFSPAGVAEFGGRTYVALQVIWAIGASMVVLAGAQFLGRHACLAIGAAILLGHNLLDPIWPAASTTGSTAPVWAALHARQLYDVGPFAIFFSYPLLPWIGVMLLGYGAAGLFELPAKLRDRWLLRIGVGLVIAFILIRALNVYGDPQPWNFDPGNTAASVMSFLATTKYPPSLLYILMTLGPAAIACAFVERLCGSIRNALVTLGRAPLAFYIAHLYLIHAAAILLGVVQGFAAQQFLTHYRLLSRRLWRRLAGGLPDLDRGCCHPLPALPMGRSRKGAATGLVAELLLLMPPEAHLNLPVHAALDFRNAQVPESRTPDDGRAGDSVRRRTTRA